VSEKAPSFQSVVAVVLSKSSSTSAVTFVAELKAVILA
jgi:hypothetical protein